MTDESRAGSRFPPAGESDGKTEQIAAMFDAIAPRYDLLNRVLSMGIDQRWRRRAVRLLGSQHPSHVLDVATGTGDLAVQALSVGAESVVGVDIAERMLDVGRHKIEQLGLSDRVTLQYGDAMRLPFDDGTFDAALVAFGVRNFENLKSGLVEIHRVLRPSGVLVVLEFSRPRGFPVRQLYSAYSRYILPVIGRLLSGDTGAYSYLPASIQVFPDGDDFLEIMRGAGFVRVSAERLTFGVASIYMGHAERR